MSDLGMIAAMRKMNDDKMAAIKLVKALRKALGLNQAEIAKLLGVSRQTVNYVETGRSGFSKDLTKRYCELMRLIGEYGMEIEILLSCADANADRVRQVVEHYTEDIIRYLEGRK